MTDEARRLLAQLADDLTLDAPRLPSVYTDRLESIRAFLAQPEPAAREAVLEQELMKQRNHWRAALVAFKGNETVDIDYASALQAESDLTRLLADTSPAAVALLAQGERLRKALRRIAAAPSLAWQVGAIARAALALGEECICGLPEPAPTQHGFHCPKACGESPSRDN